MTGAISHHNAVQCPNFEPADPVGRAHGHGTVFALIGLGAATADNETVVHRLRA